MKKTISVVLALMMIFSMFATASAATSLDEAIGSYYGTIENPFLRFDNLPITISAQRSGPTNEYTTEPLSIVDSNVSSGVFVDFKTTLGMERLRSFLGGHRFIDTLSDAAKREFYDGKVSTDITVEITCPGVSVTNTNAGSLDSNNIIFVEVPPRQVDTNNDKVTIRYNNNKTRDLSVRSLIDNRNTYLPDLTFILDDGVAKYTTEGKHVITVRMDATTEIKFDNDTPGVEVDDKSLYITYWGEKDYQVSIRKPSTGGGSSYNTIKLVTNGGNELKNISIRRGGKVSELPVPVREGYVFTGWYTDSALKTPFDKDTVINKNYTLYAAWVEDSGTVEIVHETPEMLNGEDHFAYVLGYPDGTVRPNANITRAEVTSIFFRLLKDEVREENLTNDNSFNDVDGEDWYNTAVSTMAKLGIVNGRTADEFVPNANITRAEFAAICARFDESQYSIVDKFTDIISHWAEDEIHETAAYGWIKGYEDGTFKPDKAITRAEAMTMINRVLNRVPETADDLLSDMIVWPDNSESDWYYIPVQEATNGHNYEMKNNIYEKWTEITDVTDWTKYE